MHSIRIYAMPISRSPRKTHGASVVVVVRKSPGSDPSRSLTKLPRREGRLHKACRCLNISLSSNVDKSVREAAIRNAAIV
jgi:hypothetical protein